MESLPFHLRLLNLIKDNLFVSALISVGVICLSIGLIQYFTPASQQIEFKSGESGVFASDSAKENIVVDVSGEVESPGVYELEAEARLKDALTAAGGLGVNADRIYVSKALNLASKLHDGVKIYIPAVGEENIQPQVLSSGSEIGAAASGLASINSASQTELEGLTGIGPVTALKIINNRPYASLEELISKKSVGKSLFEKIKEQISL